MEPIQTFAEIVARVPAYGKFLTEKLGQIPEVKSMDDFLSLPLTSKADYIMQYPVPDLCVDGNPNAAHIWLRSSGTSRKPFFWPRRMEDEKNLPQGLATFFSQYVAPEAQPTLIVVGLALGPWGTGMQTSYAFRILAQKTPGLAVVSPGLNNDHIIEALERISPYYRQTLFLSYPPFAAMALEKAKSRGLDLPSLNIHLFVGGEGIIETYRERMWKLLGYTERNLDSVRSMYGSTDFANVGSENVLTIAIRRFLAQPGMAQQILGEPDCPMLFHQVPGQTHFEVVDGELVVTRLQGIPLVRYRTGDHVQIIPRKELLARLNNAGFDAEQAVRDAGFAVPNHPMPFVALYGRIDQTIFFYGAKITIEQIKTALDTETMAPYYNGRFLARGMETDTGDPQVEITLEQSDALAAADLDEVAELLSRELEKVQSEFRQVRSLMPEKKHLKIAFSDSKAFELGWKTRHM